MWLRDVKFGVKRGAGPLPGSAPQSNVTNASQEASGELFQTLKRTMNWVGTSAHIMAQGAEPNSDKEESLT